MNLLKAARGCCERNGMWLQLRSVVLPLTSLLALLRRF